MGSVKKTMDFNPFPGLRPFTPEEKDIFFGRESESTEVLMKLLKNNFVAVTGGSGTGKSSLVYSGILPQLIEKGKKESVLWKTISLRPGNDPFTNLGEAILENLYGRGFTGKGLETVLLSMHLNADGIASTIRKYLIKSSEKILVIVDQFEELFRYSKAGSDSNKGVNIGEFVEKLAGAVNKPGSDIYLIITIRSDFVEECSYFQGLTQLINNSNYLVPHLNRNNYRKVIENPIKYAGATIDTKLVEAILDDIGDRSDQLPVLQHALMRTWTLWQKLSDRDQPISKNDYESAGTLKDAMSKHASEAFEELDGRGKEVCEKLFKTITVKGTDTKGLRRPTSVRNIKSIINCSTGELFDVLEKFRDPSRAFITPEKNAPLNDDSIIDLSHESLIWLWDLLSKWVEEEADSVQKYLNLSELSAMYQQGKTGLLKPPDLHLFIKWRDRQTPTLAWAERYDPAYERAMVYLRTSEKVYLEEEERKIRWHKKKVRKARIVALILGTVATISIGLMVFAIVSKIASHKQAILSEQKKREAEIQKVRADSSARAALKQRSLAVTSAEIAEKKADEAIKEMEEAKRQIKIAEVTRKQAQQNEKIAVSQSDSEKKASERALENERVALEQIREAKRLRMLSISRSMSLKSLQMKGQKDLQTLLAYQAYLFNKQNGGFYNDPDVFNGLYNVAVEYGNKDYRSFSGHNGQVTSIAFVPGKGEFYTAGDDGQILKWSLDEHTNTYQVIYSGNDIVDVLAISPDASWLACGSRTSAIRMIPLKDNSMQYELKGHSGNIKSLIFSFDGKSLYSASLDGKVLKWDLTARTSKDVTTGNMRITAIDLSFNGNYLAGISSEGNVMIWNPDNKTDNFPVETSLKNINAIRFKPDEYKLAIGDREGNVELWDLSTRKRISAVKAHDSQVNSIQFNTLLNQMATAGNDKALKIFNITDMYNLTDPPITFPDNDGFILAIQFSPDGELIVSGGNGASGNLVSRPVSTDNLVKDICSLVTRNMTKDEWNAYVAKDIPPEETCPERSFNIKVNVVQ